MDFFTAQRHWQHVLTVSYWIAMAILGGVLLWLKRRNKRKQ